jgi:hypothetical protein
MHAMTAANANSLLPIRRFRAATAAVCLGLFLILQLFAAFKPLHHEVCADAAASSHECVITLLAQGHFSTPVFAAGFVLAILGFALWIPALQLPLLCSFDPTLVPTRGPPCR